MDLRVFLFFCIANVVQPAAIPIWERLTHQEKVGALSSKFAHLVEISCKQTFLPDCEKVLMLYGVSKLVQLDTSGLDSLDPYQRDADDLLWESLVGRGFSSLNKIGKKKEKYGSEDEYDFNEIDEYGMDYQVPNYENDDYEDSLSHPYAVMVPAPGNVHQREANAHSLSDEENHLFTGSVQAGIDSDLISQENLVFVKKNEGTDDLKTVNKVFQSNVLYNKGVNGIFDEEKEVFGKKSSGDLFPKFSIIKTTIPRKENEKIKQKFDSETKKSILEVLNSTGESKSQTGESKMRITTKKES